MSACILGLLCPESCIVSYPLSLLTLVPTPAILPQLLTHHYFTIHHLLYTLLSFPGLDSMGPHTIFDILHSLALQGFYSYSAGKTLTPVKPDSPCSTCSEHLENNTTGLTGFNGHF